MLLDIGTINEPNGCEIIIICISSPTAVSLVVAIAPPEEALAAAVSIHQAGRQGADRTERKSGDKMQLADKMR